MAQLRYAEVRFKGEIAGTLQETPNGGTLFEYAPNFTESIACVLPRQKDQHSWSAGLHPFFEHLGPEGWLRNCQARTAEIDVEDDFGILLEYGEDCIGAVSLHNPGAEESRSDRRRLDELTLAAVQNKRTISGVQPKILATKHNDEFHSAGPGDAAPYIAKFPTDDVPDLVPNESKSLRVARLLLGDDRVTQSQRGLVDQIKKPALLIKRFDRTEQNQKLRLEDFAQILCKPKRRDFSGKYNAGFEDIASAIDAHSALPTIDKVRFFQQIVAYAIIGNCDCHLKNFSLLETGRGLRLSPAYDIVNTYIYGREGFSTGFGLRLLGRVRQFEEIKQDILAALGREIGLASSIIAETFKALKSKQDAVLAAVSTINFRTDDPKDYARLYEETLRSSFLRICE